MNDKDMRYIMKKIDAEAEAPEGVKEKIFFSIFSREKFQLTPFEEFIFKKPLRAAFITSISVTGAIWAAMGKDFAKILTGLIG